MKLEWKSIEEDGLPSEYGSYWVELKSLSEEGERQFLVYNNPHLSADFIIRNIKNYYGPLDLPAPKDEVKKHITFTEALKIVLDGGKVRQKNSPKGNYIFIKDGELFEKSIDIYRYIIPCEEQMEEWIIVEEAPTPKEEKKYITFIEALRVVFNGGIVEANINDRIRPYNYLTIPSFLANSDCDEWVVKMAAPKPKMPEKIRFFKEHFDRVLYLNEIIISKNGGEFVYKQENHEKSTTLIDIYKEFMPAYEQLLKLYQEEK